MSGSEATPSATARRGLAVDRLEDPRRDRRQRRDRRAVPGERRAPRGRATRPRSGRSPPRSSGRDARRPRAAPGSATGAGGRAGRGAPRCCVAAASVTSMPVRSISSNGPIGKPAARIAPSIGLDAGVAGLEHPQRLDGERPVDPVDDEARGVGGTDRGLAPGRHQRRRPVGDGRVRRRRGDDLDERHQRRGIEEVQAEDALRPAPTRPRWPPRTARSCWSPGWRRARARRVEPGEDRRA